MRQQTMFESFLAFPGIIYVVYFNNSYNNLENKDNFILYTLSLLSAKRLYQWLGDCEKDKSLLIFFRSCNLNFQH